MTYGLSEQHLYIFENVQKWVYLSISSKVSYYSAEESIFCQKDESCKE